MRTLLSDADCRSTIARQTYDDPASLTLGSRGTVHHGGVTRLSILTIVLATWLAALVSVSGIVVAQDAGTFRPPPAPEQPIPFSHQQHATAGAGCADCHRTATTDARAGIPLTAQCLKCHAQSSTPALKALSDLAAAGEVPWRRVVRLPDYVFFNHKTHMASKGTTCETCHGKVQEMTATQKVYDMSMAACIECHKQRNAPEMCDTCHEPRG